MKLNERQRRKLNRKILTKIRQSFVGDGFKQRRRPTGRERLAKAMKLPLSEAAPPRGLNTRQYSRRHTVFPPEVFQDDPFAGRLARVAPGPFVGQPSRAERRAAAREAGVQFQPLTIES